MTSKTYPAFPHPEPKAIIIFCGDPRFLVATNSFITEELGFKEGEYLPLSLPGGISSLSEPFALPKDFKVLKEGLQFYLEHMASITEVILINHEDCRKYHSLVEKLGPLNKLRGSHGRTPIRRPQKGRRIGLEPRSAQHHRPALLREIRQRRTYAGCLRSRVTAESMDLQKRRERGLHRLRKNALS